MGQTSVMRALVAVDLGAHGDDATPPEDLYLHARFGRTATEAESSTESTVIGRTRALGGGPCWGNYDLDNPDHSIGQATCPNESLPWSFPGAAAPAVRRRSPRLAPFFSSDFVADADSRLYVIEPGQHSDDQTPGEDLFFHAYYGRTAEGARTNPLSVVLGLQPLLWEGGCTPDNVNFGSEDHRYVSISVVDRAGNVSVRSEPIELPGADPLGPMGCGCNHSAAVIPALAGLLLFWLRRNPRANRT
jgi:hypothetical protein